MQETIQQPEGGAAVRSSDRLCPVKFTKIVSFSFGQTSGYMLRKLMDANPQTFDDDFCVVFANTGREHEATLDFGHEVEMRWGVKIVWLEYCRENDAHSQKVVSYETAARRNAPGPFDAWLSITKTLPNVRARGCSSDLKTRIIKRWLKSIGVETYEDYVGIRSDEAHRKLEILAQMPKYITGKFPLCDDGTTKETVNNWWDAHDFRLNIPNHQGNCDMCFLKAKWKRLSIAQREPQHAQWWADWERKMRERGVTGRGAQWIDGQSYEGIIAASQHPEFDFSEQDVPCSCAVSGYRDADDEGHKTIKLMDAPLKTLELPQDATGAFHAAHCSLPVYYEDAAVTIYHADSREVIPELPLQKFSLMATDPPYGMAFGGFRGVEQNVRADGARQGIRLVRSVVFEAMPHMKEDAHFYVFCHWESWPDFYDALTAYINVKSSLIWWKNRGGMGDTEMEYARDYEVILYGATGRRPLAGKRDGAVISGISPEGNIKTRCHPTQKPEGLMGYLIEKSCPPGEWVLDPFMGSGSTLVAAKQRGRRAVGIELNEAYCESAAKRCASEMAMCEAENDGTERPPGTSGAEGEARPNE